MDEAIKSDSNKAVAKAHIDLVGSYMQSLYTMSCKGVHAELTQMEAIKAVFHTYLVVADILNYLDKKPIKQDSKLNIHKASMDELESVLGVNRTIVKEIVKLRVKNGSVDLKSLSTIKGIGQKTLLKAEQVLSFDPV